MDEFEPFWSMVQAQAQRAGGVFFLNCGEGREFETEDMEGEDLFGWLIPAGRAEEFQREWEGAQSPLDVGDEWSGYLTYVVWSAEGGTVSVRFQNP